MILTCSAVLSAYTVKNKTSDVIWQICIGIDSGISSVVLFSTYMCNWVNHITGVNTWRVNLETMWRWWRIEILNGLLEEYRHTGLTWNNSEISTKTNIYLAKQYYKMALIWRYIPIEINCKYRHMFMAIIVLSCFCRGERTSIFSLKYTLLLL